LHSVFGIY